ncbi:MAG: hypothetical protein ACFCUJ_11265, partial [Thiotrichales bacterium]
ELAGPPNNWTAAQIRHNVLNKYSVDQIRGTDFDPESIMLYFFPARWTKNGVSTQDNDMLSRLDKAFIASEHAYPREASAAVDLTIDAPTATAADIGTPGEEDVFRFVTEQGGRHVIETSGNTDVVMQLFGPDSQTTLIAEDDDSGQGLNARIAAELIPGQYWAQVRHYRQASGTGQYGIRVRTA